MKQTLQKLSPQQLANLTIVRDKWIDIGLRTGPGSLKDALAGICKAYVTAGREAPKIWVWLDSPLAAVYGCAVLAQVRDQVRDQVLAQVSDQVRAQVSDQVSDQVSAQVLAQVRAQVSDQVSAQVLAQVSDQVLDQVRAQVRDQVLDQVRDQVSDQVSDQVLDQVRAQVLAQVRAQVSDQVLAQVRDQVSDQVREFANFYYWWYPGQFEGWWLAFYEALRDHCEFEKLAGLIEVAESCAFAWTFPDVVVFSAPPVEIHRNAEGQLHCETGPAVKFADGWGVWALNGVRLTQEIVETPASELDPKLVTTTENAEWRREIVRKIGIERICEALNAKSVDKDGEYELLMLTLGDRRQRPYLKMRNPSIGVFHIEGVSPECRTVQQALNFRNGLTPAMIDDVDGEDWIQQGDVILRPRGAQKFKSRPIVLT